MIKYQYLVVVNVINKSYMLQIYKGLQLGFFNAKKHRRKYSSV